MNGMALWLDTFFKIRERGSTLGTEVRGGAATFLTMAYILVANPTILASAGVPLESAVACTALAAGIACLAMGLTANMPLALASGMGLNAVVAFQVAQIAGSWQTAMGLVVLDGLVIVALVLTGLREAVMDAIPADLRRAIAGGIGLFIALIGLVNAGIVVAGPTGGPPLMHGDLTQPATAVAAVGLLLTAWLLAKRVPGAMLIGIAGATVLALAFGVSHLPKSFSLPHFSNAFQADVKGALRPDLLPLLLAIVLVDFFDTLGTASAVADQAGLRDAEGRIPRLRALLVVDSLAASLGGLLGVSSVTSYVESAAGVAEGARTGLHTVVVALLFFASILAAPLLVVVPSCATAPVLVLVGFLMFSQVVQIDFTRFETAIPAFVTFATIPLTYSIAHGIGYGFLSYVGMKSLSGRFREVHPLMYPASAAFLAYFLWERAR
jgi:AGZA family xanthine/uracil permease-like MFS transporter